jgi:threonyl-tRNA synthetase
MTMYDHRKLGRELELFGTDPLIGAGLPYWLPAGAAIRHALEEYIREAERRAGYQHVYSPVLGKRELYEISGHWSHYREGMCPPMDIGGAVAHLIDVHGGAFPAWLAPVQLVVLPVAGAQAPDPRQQAGALPGGDRRPRGGRRPGGAAAAGRLGGGVHHGQPNGTWFTPAR